MGNETKKFKKGDKVVPAFKAKSARVGYVREVLETGYEIFWLHGVGLGYGWYDSDLDKANGYI